MRVVGSLKLYSKRNLDPKPTSIAGFNSCKRGPKNLSSLYTKENYNNDKVAQDTHPLPNIGGVYTVQYVTKIQKLFSHWVPTPPPYS
jgi:hypothetical protein